MITDLVEPVSPVNWDVDFLNDLFPTNQSELSNELAKAKQDLSEKETTIQTLQQQVGIIMIDKLAFNDQREKLMSENCALKNENTQLGRKVKELESQVEVWKIHSESLSAEGGRMQSTIAQRDMHIVQLQQHIYNMFSSQQVCGQSLMENQPNFNCQQH